MTRNSWVLVISTQNQCYVGNNGRYICNGAKAHKKNPKIDMDTLIDALACKKCLKKRGIL